MTEDQTGPLASIVDEAEFTLSATAAKQVGFAKTLADKMELEKEVVLLPEAVHEKWVNGDGIVVTPNTFEQTRREAWMFEVFKYLLEEASDGNGPRFKSLLDEHEEAFYSLLTEVGRESITAVLEEYGYNPKEWHE
jgi:hypothetical protein